MAIEVAAYEARHVPAVRAFNSRLTAGGVEAGLLLPLSEARPRAPDAAVWREQYLLLEEGEVRGGFMLQRQCFWMEGEMRDTANCQLPVSEGIVDRKYAHLGMLMFRKMAAICPRIFCVGMGGMQMPLPRLLASMGWHVAPVPFRFRVLRAGRFLRQVRALRRTPMRALAMNLAAWSGVGKAGLEILQRRGRRPAARLRLEAVRSWPDWVDAIWHASRASAVFIGQRDRAGLEGLYPMAETRVLRLGAWQGSRPAGCLALLNTQMRGHDHFGDLRVGTILDGMATSEHLPALLQGAVEALADGGADLVVANQSHRDWLAAFGAAGFLEGPSNYLLALNKPLVAALAPIEVNWARIHLSRGDGDGRIHL